MEGDKGAVCVTGGTGYIASWLIMRLLEQGYCVRCTVRPDPERKKDISYLTNLPGATERLQIFDADLNKPDSFNEAIEGCIGVFHVAHPVEVKGKEPEEIVSKRTVEGTIGILKACLNSRTVKRVVYTSSASTVLFNGKENQDIVDESSWSDLEVSKSVETRDCSYVASKVKTERAALDFAQEHGLDVVTLLPSLVVGPFICHSMPFSVYMGLAMIFGNQELYKYMFNSNMVHIDDVARALIHLFEYNPNAKGRHICSSNELTINQMAELLSKKYPNLQIPTADELKDIKGYKISGLTSKKLVESGFKFQYGLDDMYDGAVQSCKEKGFL